VKLSRLRRMTSRTDRLNRLRLIRSNTGTARARPAPFLVVDSRVYSSKSGPAYRLPSRIYTARSSARSCRSWSFLTSATPQTVVGFDVDGGRGVQPDR